jgi:CHAT domain-containing protein
MRFIDPAIAIATLGVRCSVVFVVSLLLLTTTTAAGTRSIGLLGTVAHQVADARRETGDEQDLRVLGPGQPIERRMSGGESHYYRIMLVSDEYLRLVLDQRGIDVLVTLYGPDGKMVAVSNRFTGEYGPEPISWVAENPGLYRLEVRSPEREKSAGRYAVEILEERVATLQDRRRIAPQSVLMQAEQLRAQKTAESLDKAIAKYEEALQIWREVGDRSGEAETLNIMGLVYHLLKRDTPKARDHYNQALQIWRSAGDRRGEAEALNNIARVYESLGERQIALDHYAQALQPWRDAGDRYGEAWTLYNMGRVYYFLKMAQKAIDYHTRALKIWRDLGDLSREAAALNSIGEAYVLLNDYKNALHDYEQARQRWQAVGDLNGEVSTLFSISKTYSLLSDQQKESEFKGLAEQLKEQVRCTAAEALKDEARWDKSRLAEQAQNEARQLLSLATEESRRRAIDKNEEAVHLFDGIGDFGREIFALFDISSIYRMLQNKEKEREALARSLSLGLRISEPSLKAEALQRFGDYYLFVGDKLKTIDYYNRALEVWRFKGDRTSEASLLGSAAGVYNKLGEKQKALDYLERALALYQAVGDRFREAYTLNDLAAIYASSEEKQKALDYLKRVRNLRREKGDRAGEADTLKDLIAIYLSVGEKQEALEYYHQALAMYREIGDGMGEADTLRDLMIYWKELDQPRLAIFYGKQGVNTYQEIRRNIQGLDKETQESFLKSKEDIYRQLADLLISEARLPEAQQVLDMLKEEEYFNFIRRKGRRDPSPTDRADLTPRETDLYRQYREITERATVIGSEYDKLLAKKGRSSDDDKQLKDLSVRLQVTNEGFRNYLNQLSKAFLHSDEISDRVKSIKGYEGLKVTLRELGSGTVALYTLATKDKYRVIVFTPSVKVARQYSIKATDLNRKIMALRVALQDPMNDPLPPAKELYQILVGPVAKDLEGANAKTLMWSLDGALRYVPIAALHDGEKYMVERYRNEIFTLSSLSRLGNSPSTTWRGLGFGVSNSSEGFDPLPAVREELSGIFRKEEDPNAHGGILPGKVMLDDAFTKDAMITALQLQEYRLVHIASHFQLMPGDGMGSYLVLGKGGKLTVAEIYDLPDVFSGVDLLTLSACNTAIGISTGNGEEVDAFGELAQRQGAKAVIASLWSVADASTGLLMQKFYQLRMQNSGPGITKVEALQEAQLAFLHKEVKAPEFSEKDYAHPYFWAPFILIGNWK